MARTYFRLLAIFWLVFGLITTFYPRLMHLFMTQRGVDATTAFSNHVWMHDGLDILAVSILLFVFSTLPATRITLAAAATVSLLPAIAIGYSLAATSYWSALFLMPAAAALALAVWGFALARGESTGTRAAAVAGGEPIAAMPDSPQR
jgi:hypothetical protein